MTRVSWKRARWAPSGPTNGLIRPEARACGAATVEAVERLQATGRSFRRLESLAGSARGAADDASEGFPRSVAGWAGAIRLGLYRNEDGHHSFQATSFR